MSSEKNHTKTKKQSKKSKEPKEEFTTEDIVRESGIKMIAKYPPLIQTARPQLSEFESYESLREEQKDNFLDSHFKFTQYFLSGVQE